MRCHCVVELSWRKCWLVPDNSQQTTKSQELSEIACPPFFYPMIWVHNFPLFHHSICITFIFKFSRKESRSQFLQTVGRCRWSLSNKDKRRGKPKPSNRNILFLGLHSSSKFLGWIVDEIMPLSLPSMKLWLLFWHLLCAATFTSHLASSFDTNSATSFSSMLHSSFVPAVLPMWSVIQIVPWGH